MFLTGGQHFGQSNTNTSYTINESPLYLVGEWYVWRGRCCIVFEHVFFGFCSCVCGNHDWGDENSIGTFVADRRRWPQFFEGYSPESWMNIAQPHAHGYHLQCILNEKFHLPIRQPNIGIIDSFGTARVLFVTQAVQIFASSFSYFFSLEFYRCRKNH